MAPTPIMQAVRAFEEIDALMLGTHHPATGRVMEAVRRGIGALAPFLNPQKEPAGTGSIKP